MSRSQWFASGSVLLGLSLAMTACTSTNVSSAAPPTVAASHSPTTITVWSFNRLDNEVKAFQNSFTKLHEANPWLTVKFVPNKDDDAFAKAVAAGTPPDVFIADAPYNVAKFCHNRTVVDLNPYLKSAGIDAAKTFPAATTVYTQYEGKQCGLPILTDAFALVYNKKMFADAGITAPPKTLDELTEVAKKLTVKNPDGSIKRFGFVSRSDYNANSWMYMGVNAGAKFYGPDGKVTVASDPKWTSLLEWDKSLNDWYGNDQVQAFVGKYQPHTDDADNAFIKGDVAMAIEGEWHVGELADLAPSLDYGVAPTPMLDSASYGAGATAGTVAYVPAGSKHQSEAAFTVTQLATDTTFLNTLADTVYNIPSTFAALAAWDKASDPHWKPYVDIFQNPGTYFKAVTPAGAEDRVTWRAFLLDYESGKVTLPGGLTDIATKIDSLNTAATR
jgi:multiple sugar transport system substrate-binding protein